MNANSSSDTTAATNFYKARYLTIPNIICGFRIIGSLALLWPAMTGWPTVFVGLFVVLHLSDWVDGKLARWLNQRSDFGARLDSVSDTILYGCLILGCVILKWDILRSEAAWLAVPLACYALTTGYGLWKYGRVPSYHTRFAKWTNWLVLGGAVALLLDWSLWPLRLAAIAGTATNLESVAITYVLPTWRVDVLSLREARRLRDAPP